ncbi:unnamed protein product [Rotaria socialis]
MTDAKVLAQMSSTAVQQRCMKCFRKKLNQKCSLRELTIYNVIKRYRKHNSTNYLPKTGRPKKISDQELKTLVRLVDNMVGVSQRRLGRRFELNQLIVSPNLRKRTSVPVYKRRSAPKYISDY